MQKITPFLWFDKQAEAAATFYVSIFPNSRIDKVARYGDAGPGPKGSVMTVSFTLDGQEFAAINGGPQFKFSPATAFIINCATQAEVDHYWDALSVGGQVQQCGWLTDRFGFSWNIVPTLLPELLSGADADKSQRVMQAMLKMVKLDIEALQRA